MTRANRPALGRGLDALFPQPDAQPDGAPAIRQLPLDAIEPNPQQPRKTFGGPQAAELTQSIAEHGILQPLLVRQLTPDRYQLIAGERRWRAARAAGLHHAPAVVLNTPDSDLLTIALVENLQREDLNPIDQAAAFQYLLDAGLSQTNIARQIGKSRAAVANTIRLLQLPPAIQQHLAEARLTEGHARAILAAPKQHRQHLAETAINQNLTVRQIEAQARTLQAAERKTTEPTDTKNKRTDTDRTTAETEHTAAEQTAATEAWRKQAADRLQRAYHTRAAITQDSNTGGRITLRWYSQEQLEQLITQLTTPPNPSDPPNQITI